MSEPIYLFLVIVMLILIFVIQIVLYFTQYKLPYLKHPCLSFSWWHVFGAQGDKGGVFSRLSGGGTATTAWSTWSSLAGRFLYPED